MFTCEHMYVLWAYVCMDRVSTCAHLQRHRQIRVAQLDLIYESIYDMIHVCLWNPVNICVRPGSGGSLVVAGSSPEFGDPYSTKKFSISSFRSKLDVPQGRGLGDLYCGRALSILFALHAMAVSGTMCLHVLCGKCKTLATFASAWQARVEIEMRVWLEGTMRRTTNDSLQDSDQ